MRICIFEIEILIEPGDEEYVSYTQNFMTFGKYETKVMA